MLLEAGFDELNGISWTKGCYMGQELTARTRYRGLLKRRLVPVTISGPAPEPGTPVMSGERDVGTMRSVAGGQGLAVLRLDVLNAGPLACGDATLTPVFVKRSKNFRQLGMPKPGKMPSARVVTLLTAGINGMSSRCACTSAGGSMKMGFVSRV